MAQPAKQAILHASVIHAAVAHARHGEMLRMLHASSWDHCPGTSL